MKRFFKSFSFAFHGIIHCVQKERNFSVQVVITILVVTGGLLLNISSIEWMFILVNIALVTGFEMMNTAIERICNFVHPQQNSLIKIIKDVAAGAVMVVSIVAIICGVVIFLPKIFQL